MYVIQSLNWYQNLHWTSAISTTPPKNSLSAKTDKLDAQVLADYAQVIKPKETEFNPPQALVELVRHQEQTTQALAKLKTQAHQATDPFVLANLDTQCDALKQHLSAIEAELKRRIMLDSFQIEIASC